MPTVPPKIESMSPRTTKVEVGKGAVVRLTCTASGKPTPTITWSRKVGRARCVFVCKKPFFQFVEYMYNILLSLQRRRKKKRISKHSIIIISH